MPQTSYAHTLIMRYAIEEVASEVAREDLKGRIAKLVISYRPFENQLLLQLFALKPEEVESYLNRLEQAHQECFERGILNLGHLERAVREIGNRQGLRK